jgi:DNA-binding transcriptional MerR regulator
VNTAAKLLTPSEAAKRLGVSAKALRLYEERGLVTPNRTAAGWRVYGPRDLACAAEIVTLRALGLSLGQVSRVLRGNAQDLEPALAAHQAVLKDQARVIAGTVGRVRALRRDLANGQAPTIGKLAGVIGPANQPRISFDLPWPWDGTPFELRDMRALNHIIGPLGCGKTRLAFRIAKALSDATFLGLDRLTDKGAAVRERLDKDAALAARVRETLAWLSDEGGTASDALLVLLAALEADGPAVLVIDMLEQGLDAATQAALMTYLRRRGPNCRALVFLTRSGAILDLDAVGADETILYCPANHSPPMRVIPVPGSPGYESVATCLASPEVRARTAGVVAMRPSAA